MSTNQNHSGSGHNISVSIEASEDIRKNPSILSEIINKIANGTWSEKEVVDLNFENFEIHEKIEFNNLGAYKELIDEHKGFQGKLNALFSELDSSGSNKKNLLLKRIRNLYLEIKGSILEQTKPDNEITKNGTEVFNRIYEVLYAEILSSANNFATQEAIRVGLYIVLVDAFMRCKILEVPKK